MGWDGGGWRDCFLDGVLEIFSLHYWIRRLVSASNFICCDVGGVGSWRVMYLQTMKLWELTGSNNYLLSTAGNENVWEEEAADVWLMPGSCRWMLVGIKLRPHSGWLVHYCHWVF
jgi:hypothetical protein